MELTIAKWGNSLAVRLPSQLARQVHLTEGTTVQITAVDGVIMITPVRKRHKLADLLTAWPEGERAGEEDWGRPAGTEAW